MADDQRMTASKVRDLYDKGCKALALEQRQWWINTAFVSGEQWLRWDARAATLQREEAPDGRQRITMNRLLPSSRIIVAKLLRRPLVFEVPPKSADDASIHAARTARGAVEDIARRHNWEGLRRENAWHTWKGGTGILALEWDAEGGVDIGETTDQGRSIGTGDTRELALSIVEAVWEPGVRNAETARWWIHAAALPPSEVQDRYALVEAPKADASAALSPIQQKLLRNGRDEQPVDLTLVLTYYERPTATSKGRVAVVVGGEVVSQGGWPFPFRDRLNLVVARETPVDGRASGDTVLSAAISPQVALNMSHSSIAEHMDKAGNARLVAPESGREEEYDDDPASVLHEDGHDKGVTRYLSPPQMPQWWMKRPDDLEREIDDILGVHDVSRGNAPGSVTSGVGLTLLAEQDDTPLGALAKELAEAWSRFASLVLETLAAKVTDPRTATIERAGWLPEEVAWTGTEFRGQTRVTVPLEAVAPRSQAAQLQLGMDLLKAGQFGPPGEPATMRRFARFVELPGSDDFAAGLDPHTAKAKRENASMAAGKAVEPAPFDDHLRHVEEHNEWRLSEEYERSTPDVREAMDLHIQAHTTMAAEEVGRQRAKQTVDPALAEAADGSNPAELPDQPGPAVAPPDDEEMVENQPGEVV